MRRKLMDCVWGLPDGWRSVTIKPDGRVTIRQAKGADTTLLPPGPGRVGS
ncbi:MAG: hypothetical protein K8T91_16685 [Planctomycetes bacterium]|nr:hypothetical protein [Planctomycetota bacterium]